jgi:hypothetical protein
VRVGGRAGLAVHLGGTNAVNATGGGSWMQAGLMMLTMPLLFTIAKKATTKATKHAHPFKVFLIYACSFCVMYPHLPRG